MNWAIKSLQLLFLVPMKTNIFKKLALSYRTNPSSIKDIDELWEISQWQQTQLARSLYRPFPVMRPDAVYLASLRFEDVMTTDLPLSPRMAGFVKSAEPRDVWREAITLACMIETGSTTFNPSSINTAAGHDNEDLRRPLPSLAK